MNKNTGTFHNTVSKISRSGLIILLIALFSSLQSIPIARAAIITVSSTSDNLTVDTVCTLREAIRNSNLADGGASIGSGPTLGGGCVVGDGSGVDTITLPAGTYLLDLTGVGEDANATGDLDITDDIIINGAGTGVTIIDGNLTDRVIHARLLATVNLNNLTIQHGQIGTIAGNVGNGGGIYRQSTGDMTLNDVDILDNLAGHRGGGLENANATGIVTLTNCTVSENRSNWGGGLVSATGGAETTITNSAFSNNTANNRGGGLNVHAGTVTVENSAFTGNHNPNGLNGGGGLGNSGTLNIINSTVSGNDTNGNGGGIYRYGGTTTVSNSTITNNTADNDNNGSGDGGGIYGAVNFQNSIVIGNNDNSTPGNDDCANGAVTSGYNLVGISTGCPSGGTGDITTGSPLLGTLADNGGPTQTHALGVGSPAIDAGNNATCTTADQRGMSRVDGNGDSTATCDIGAYEAGEMQCSISINTYTFSSQSSVAIQVTSVGSNLGCLYVDERQTDHPNATSGGSGMGIATGKYWTINGVQSDGSTSATTDYALNLTLPHSVAPDTDAQVCKYPGSQGGYGWDCNRTSSTGSTVLLDGISSLSDWAVGDQVGPTAVNLQSSSVAGQSFGWVAALFTLLALAMGGLWLRRVKR